MITVVVPTLNAESSLAISLAALVPATVDGLVREIIVVDGGSTDRTLDVVEQSGAILVRSARGRGAQLATGARHARMPWLLFLHADTVLESGWEREASVLIGRVESGQRSAAAGAFRFALDDVGFKPRLIEAGVALRCALFRLPYGDQGLLISRRLYQEIGGYKPMPLMEDVDIVRRLRRSRTIMLRSRAVTSAIRYHRDGYLRRTLRNFLCLTLYFLRVPVDRIAGFYR